MNVKTVDKTVYAPDAKHVIIAYLVKVEGLEQWIGELYTTVMVGIDENGSPIHKAHEKIYSGKHWSRNKALETCLAEYYKKKHEENKKNKDNEIWF